MNTHHTPETSVGDLVASMPQASHILEELGIDYCCGGKRSLAEACAEKDLEARTLLSVLNACEHASPSTVEPNPAEMSLSQLIEHIVSTHHAYLKKSLPRIEIFANKVADAHGERDARLRKLRREFARFSANLVAHMQKEEGILFPVIVELEGAGDCPGHTFCRIAQPINGMEMEHDDAGLTLSRFRTLTDDYTAPEWACETYRALLRTLEELEDDMHRHVHKENNILFPAALRLVKQT